MASEPTISAAPVPKPNIPPTPPPDAVAQLVDFSVLPASDNYTPHFALTIDNLFTPAECESLLKFATASANDVWEPATIQSGYAQSLVLDKEVRNSDRIIVDDTEVAEMMFKRIEGYLREYDLGVIGKIPGQVENGDRRRWKTVASTWQTWKLKRMNERLRFLRYFPGGYFRPHYDGTYVVPGGKERSFITFQLYLGGTCEGKDGSTAFVSAREGVEGRIDVEPKEGRVLLFQHAGLVHEGSDVVKGVKYTIRTDVMYEKVEDEEVEFSYGDEDDDDDDDSENEVLFS
ncbi:hypothetical protein BJ508DRAFT_415262 [Ascobolus immersus RN42]|uniref:Prolyl 4-hydroxylase alpha subunit domain-containing protein n=1 Tax=Ascobolus immersus RN42 TaxID=1160509 RepID=A0A3N4I598_ASCIM|nr:hypothetical protein BJ508DRAFT_415262 [Ascobolus immersus RN42]